MLARLHAAVDTPARRKTSCTHANEPGDGGSAVPGALDAGRGGARAGSHACSRTRASAAVGTLTRLLTSCFL